jgi:hypothetical protein
MLWITSIYKKKMQFDVNVSSTPRHKPLARYEHATLLVIGTDCIGIVVYPTTIRSLSRRPLL